MYLSIVLDIVVGESSLKITEKVFSFLLMWDKNLDSRTGWLVANPSLDTPLPVLRFI